MSTKAKRRQAIISLGIWAGTVLLIALLFAWFFLELTPTIAHE